jgi:hypothetical protein
MRTRPNLSPGQLYTLLKEQFEERRNIACVSCRVPLPYAVLRPDEVSANWRIGTPNPCVYKCDVVPAELGMQLASRYDMANYENELTPTQGARTEGG